MVNNFENVKDVVELYFIHKDAFLALVNEKLDKKDALFITLAYSDYEFDKIRMLLDDKTEMFKNKVVTSIEEGVSDVVYNKMYRNYREVENNFLHFYETYNDLLEFNIM